MYILNRKMSGMKVNVGNTIAEFNVDGIACVSEEVGRILVSVPFYEEYVLPEPKYEAPLIEEPIIEEMETIPEEVIETTPNNDYTEQEDDPFKSEMKGYIEEEEKPIHKTVRNKKKR